MMQIPRQMEPQLRAMLGKFGFHLLKDDGLWLWRDDYTDSYKIHFIPSKLREQIEMWKDRGDPEVWEGVNEA